VTAQDQADARPSTRGQIVEAELERLLRRKGVARSKRTSTWRRHDQTDRADIVVTRGTCAKLAMGFADTNPLYRNPEYASGTPWGTLLCPPGVLAWTETVNGASEGFPGCHTIWRGCEMEWQRPVMQGDEINSETALVDARIIDSDFGGGASAVQDYETRAFTTAGETLGWFRTSWHRFSREGAKESGKYQETERPQWTDDELDGIWDEYRRQNLGMRRGIEPLYVEDVEIGAEIPYIIKGPTTLTSKLAFEIRGPGGWMVGHELALKLWEEHPGLAIRNEENVPEPPVAIHWTNERAQRYLGMPAAYEAGYERINWITQLLTSWVGDHGFLRKLSVEFRGFHWQGDVVRLHGVVTGTRVVDGRHVVDLDVRTVTHRGEQTTNGTAEVELPSRDAGTAVWPR
jgi:acyl dehydratase